ncbi:hypothetical protein A3K72_00830 [Candidatus Woesearchaeota archaeon RBG_13_36_6]|nr:MAG: hypothetical protein A3K72_00830 [Candidatus Woesearchaeota archaeon RBG_13_36_6]
MNKKGVELTFNTIVVASIVLIAMVVVIMIFTNFMGKGKEGLVSFSACQNMGNGQGQCYDKDDSAREGLNCLYRYGGCGFDKQPDYCCFPEEDTTSSKDTTQESVK